MTAGAEAPAVEGDLADGEWHRLHPATPLLRGGIALLAVVGILVANLRDRILELFLHYDDSDPIDVLIERGWLIPGLLIAIGVILLGVLGFWLAWRMHTFRVTDEIVEVRSGIVFRTQRRARLDRIQGVNIARPFVARLFGAARLEISVAGNDAGVKLDYLRSADADQLRRDVLSLASGVQRAEGKTAPAPAADGGFAAARIGELLAPELDPDEAEPASVVHLSLPRLIGSLFLRDSTIILLVLLAVGLPWMIINDSWYLLVGVVPGLIGLVSYISNRFLKSLRYSIAGTPNGVRVGSGLLSTTNETLPPGRIHALEVSQPVLWRLTGWWQIKLTKASASAGQGNASASRTTVLPVGDRNDVERVLALLLPTSPADEILGIIDAGLLGVGSADEGFSEATRRARWVRPFSWRRNGFRLTERLLMLRKGRIWRSAIIVPLARMQSLSVGQGPIFRALGLAEAQPHVVAGPIYSRIGALDAVLVEKLFVDVTAAAEAAGSSDESHRWNAARGRRAVDATATAPAVGDAPLTGDASSSAPGTGTVHDAAAPRPGSAPIEGRPAE